MSLTTEAASACSHSTKSSILNVNAMMIRVIKHRMISRSIIPFFLCLRCYSAMRGFSEEAVSECFCKFVEDLGQAETVTIIRRSDGFRFVVCVRRTAHQKPTYTSTSHFPIPQLTALTIDDLPQLDTLSVCRR